MGNTKMLMERCMKRELSFSVLRIICLILLIPSLSFAKNQFVTIGTAGITGVYYIAGKSIEKIVNQKRDELGFRVVVESTAGAVFNINALMNGDLEFGIVQSDRQYQAVHGLENWEGKGPQKKLRSVFSLHLEEVTLAAAVDSGIASVKDLRGKRVNIGNPGSGYRLNAIHVLEANGLDYQKDIHAEGNRAAIASEQIESGLLEAFFYTVGHPNGTFKAATTGSRKVRFIPIDGVDQLLVQYPYYHRSVIPVALYPQAINDSDVPTIGVKAVLVTSSTIPDEIVYGVTRQVFENLEVFKAKHPAFSALSKASMLEGLSAPIHPGALQYYKKVGLKP